MRRQLVPNRIDASTGSISILRPSDWLKILTLASRGVNCLRIIERLFDQFSEPFRPQRHC